MNITTINYIRSHTISKYSEYPTEVFKDLPILEFLKRNSRFFKDRGKPCIKTSELSRFCCIYHIILHFCFNFENMGKAQEKPFELLFLVCKQNEGHFLLHLATECNLVE